MDTHSISTMFLIGTRIYKCVTHSLTHSPTHFLTHPPTHPLTCPPTYSLTHSTWTHPHNYKYSMPEMRAPDIIKGPRFLLTLQVPTYQMSIKNHVLLETKHSHSNKAWENSWLFAATRPVISQQSDIWGMNPEIPHWWSANVKNWVVFLNGWKLLQLTRRTSQNCDTSSVWKFCIPLTDVILQGNQWKFGCFH